MNVKQALKLKGKILTEISELYGIAKNHNSIQAGNIRRFSVTESLDKAGELTKELVELKTKIHRANGPVYDKIFLMAELKGRVKVLKSISTEEGTQAGRYGSAPEMKEVELTALDIRNMVKDLETQIEQLQDELDVHNATTQI
jgi:hypothetical protein